MEYSTQLTTIYMLFPFFILGILFLFILLIDKKLLLSTSRVHGSRRLAIFLFLLFALIFGLRPLSVGADTLVYNNIFHDFSFKNLRFSDYLFYSIIYIYRYLFNYNLFQLTISILVSCIYCFYSFKISNRFNVLLLFFFIFICFSTTSLYINIIRNGLAVSLFLVFSYYFIQGNRKKSLLWGFLSMLGHHTIIIPIGMMIFIKYLPKIKLKWYYIIYLFILGLSFFNIGVHQIGFLADLGIDKVNDYMLYDGTEYQIGFRLNFAIFNTFFAILFYYLNSRTKQFELYLKYYLLASCLFFLCFHIPFSDRIGLYSWIMIPILSFIGINERFPRKRQKYSLIMFIFLYTINLALTLR